MIELIIVAAIAVIGFGLVFYQSFRDKNRWNRIQSGKSLFGDREEMPPLQLEGNTIWTRERPVVVMWSDGSNSPVHTVADARDLIRQETKRQLARATDARIFAWDGAEWKQRK